MASVARDEVIDCNNPKLDLFTSIDGLSTDVAELDFEIFENDGTTVVFARTTLDPLNDCPTGARLALGHYSLGPTGWTVPSGQALGTYKIRWYFKLTATSPEQTFTEDFEVLSVVGTSDGGYALVQDFRDEGFTVAQVTDARLLKLIKTQSKRIDSLTGQWFEPRSGTMTLDGKDSVALRFPVPVISISEVRIDGTVVDSTAYRVYNRHLALGGTFEDDRGDPRIVMYREEGNLPITLWSNGTFPAGRQNIEVDGVWGYTDGPGAPGVTPELIKEALMLMVIPKMPLMSNTAARERGRLKGKIMREETRDQRVELNPRMMNNSAWGYSLTGDPEVDEILIQFMGPISIGDTGGSAPTMRVFNHGV